MTLDLEALAVARAEEQMASEAWRGEDGDEPLVFGSTCRVCDGPLKRPWAKVCSDCAEEGWRPGPCPVCGGPVNIRDRTRDRSQGHNLAGAKSYYRACAKCRAKEAA